MRPLDPGETKKAAAFVQALSALERQFDYGLRVVFDPERDEYGLVFSDDFAIVRDDDDVLALGVRAADCVHV